MQVLVEALVEVLGLEKQTIVHTPLRSWSVLSGGAAIDEVLRSVLKIWSVESSEKGDFLKE